MPKSHTILLNSRTYKVSSKSIERNFKYVRLYDMPPCRTNTKISSLRIYWYLLVTGCIVQYNFSLDSENPVLHFKNRTDMEKVLIFCFENAISIKRRQKGVVINIDDLDVLTKFCVSQNITLSTAVR